MDERHRDYLQRHHSFLMTHILLTDDVIQLMSNEKILPETMIKDIQDGDTKEERNQRLLNALRLRGNKSYKRFRELMYRIGNFFVADLLWEEEEGPRRPVIDEEELAAKFSAVLNCLQDAQKKKFLHYLDAKVREKALILAWRERPGERMESLRAKVIDFNQEKGLRDTITTQEKKIKDLEERLQEEEGKKGAVRLELLSLQQQLKTMKKEHLTQMDTQSRFHDVSMTTITRLKNTLSRCTGTMAELSALIKTAVGGGGGGGEKKTALGTKEEDREEEGEEGEKTKASDLEKHVNHLLQQYRYEKEQARQGRSQREDVLKLLNKGFTKEPLVSVVKEVLKHEQKHRAVVMRGVQRLAHSLRQVTPSATLAPPTPLGVSPTELTLHTLPLDPTTLDTKHFKSQLALLRAEAEHIQKRFQWKDSETLSLRQELMAVKQRFSDYRILNALPRNTTTGSTTTTNNTTTTGSTNTTTTTTNNTTTGSTTTTTTTPFVCTSCGRPTVGQAKGQGASVQAYSHHTSPATSASQPPPSSHYTAAAAGGGGITVSPEEGPPRRLSGTDADNDDDDDEVDAAMFQASGGSGSDSRRDSMGRSDLDKTVVNVEEYLQCGEFQDSPGDLAPLKARPSQEGIEGFEREDRHVRSPAGGLSPSLTKQTPVKRAAEGRSADPKSRRDAKNTSAKNASAWRKAVAKRKINPK